MTLNDLEPLSSPSPLPKKWF